jgi:hypothetical protein
MSKSETIDGYIFKYNSGGEFYECRGELCYDDEHDEVPEENLWTAALKLETKLRNAGLINAEAGYSEKGWVEVYANIFEL